MWRLGYHRRSAEIVGWGARPTEERIFWRGMKVYKCDCEATKESILKS